jgi:hypothetical protein
MASRIIVWKTGQAGGGGTATDHSISALNAIRGVANQVPEGNDHPQTRKLPAYVTAANRNSFANKDGGI